ncbi:MAG: hypothetical protein HN644_00955 [Rhodospirillales bacterium]|jgi:hypothetical protein|nr:hypothetical protein [Rhodospirillales bacterium]MBT4039605.1 hypothetical protein [Rhodospirillales bacterium]MBT4627731.1 hypothetical protein [Rhodospirillales bacterium]MBT5351305.1 hypothetical protein [Rhodospirillales bacterium]MBT5521456.1 hypothetical protein [Rhodospirillales bacterium]
MERAAFISGDNQLAGIQSRATRAIARASDGALSGLLLSLSGDLRGSLRLRCL